MAAKKQASYDMTVNLTPMIDMGMQLIIFFLLATQYAEADVDPKVRLPALGDKESMAVVEPSPFKLHVNILARGGGEVDTIKLGMLDVTRRANDRGGPAHLDAVIRETLAAQSKHAEENNGKLILVIRADRDVRWAHVRRIMRLAAQEKIQEVRLGAPVGRLGMRAESGVSP